MLAGRRRASLPMRLPATLRLTPLSNQFPALHGARVLAIVSVVQLHVTSHFIRLGVVAPTPLWTLSHDLWFGMDLFFLLSGFLIGTILLLDEGSTGLRRFGRFYARRSLRIIPPYFASLTLLALVLPLTAAQRANLPLEYVYLTNYVPPLPWLVTMPWAWSLAVEEHFYLVVPILLAALAALESPRARLAVLGVLWASAPLVRFATYARAAPWNYPRLMATFYVQSHLRYDILVAGVATAIIQKHYGARLRSALERPLPRALLLGTTAAAFVLLFAQLFVQTAFLGTNLVAWGTLTSIAYVPLTLTLVNGRGLLVRALSARFFLPVASLGYGIYLAHIPIIEHVLAPLAKRAVDAGLVSIGVAWIMTLGAALALSALAAYALHVLVEKPSLALRDRFAR